MRKLLVFLLFYSALATSLYGQVPESNFRSSQTESSEPPPRKTVQLDWHAELKKVQGELAHKPNSAFLHSQAATAYNALSDLPGFNREIRLAMHFDKSRAAYCYFAYAVYKQRHLKTLQVQALERALQIDPGNPFGHYERAAIFEDDNQLADALAEYQATQKMLEQVRPNPDPRSYSKWTYFDPRGDPYDVTIQRARIDDDVARVQAELAKSK
jgi:tetratricopeptide (TPR) repeat protein